MEFRSNLGFNEAMSHRPQTYLRHHIFLMVLGYLLCLGLMGLATSLGMQRLDQQNQSFRQVVQQHNVKARLMADMRDAIRERIFLANAALHLNDPFEIDSFWQAFNAQASRFIKARLSLLEMPLTEDQRRNLQLQGQIIKEVRPVLERAFRQILAGNVIDKASLAEQISGVNQNLAEELQQMIDLQQQAAEQSLLETEQLNRVATLEMFAYLTIALTIATLTLGLFILFIRRQARSLDSLVQQLNLTNETLEHRVRERTRKLRQQSQRNALIINATMDGFFIIDAHGQLIDCNQSYCHMLGYSREEMLRLRVADIEADESTAEIAAHVQRIIEQGSDRFDTRHRCSNGALLDVEVSITAHKDDNQILMFAYVHDISERKRTEAKLALMATTFDTHEAIMITDQKSRIIRVNRAFTRVTGYSAEEAVGQTPALLKSGRHDAAFYQHLWHYLLAHGHWEGEVWNRRKNGEIYPELLGITAVRNDQGTISNYVAHFTDISEIKQQQRQLERMADEEKALATLLRQALSDLDMETLLGNALDTLMKQISGLELSRGAIFLLRREESGAFLEIAGERRFVDDGHFHCRRVEMGECLCGQVAASEQLLHLSHLDQRHKTDSADMKDHGHYVLPLLYNDDLLGVMSLNVPAGHQQHPQETDFLNRIAIVISLGIHKRQTEQILLDAKLEAEQANRAKSDFLSSMSHELRTPLNAIIGFSQLLELDELDEMQRESVQEISKAGHHLLGLINEILDLAKIEAGQIVLNLESLAVQPLLTECLNLIKPLAKKHGIVIDMPNTDSRLRAHADPLRLKQAVINLLTNAIKYNRPQGRVRLLLQPIDQGQLRIAVEDSGIGISTDDQQRLFEPFDRLQAEGSGIEGTGIGLVITKTLVELMGGSIGVDSTPGQGSIFWIELQRTDQAERCPPNPAQTRSA